MDKNYDLSLGKCGPYNKEYLGATHIADSLYGTTFNVEVFPGFFRRNVIASKSISGGPVKMWKSNVNLTRFTYRYELEWKDRVYCDVTYNITDDKRIDVDCNFVNNTEVNQSVYPNVAFSLQTQKVKNGLVPLYHKTYVKPNLNANQKFVDALDYQDVKICDRYAVQGRYLGEEVCDFTSGVQGTALSGNYFYNDSHFALYSVNAQANSIGIRYKSDCDGALKIILNGVKQLLLPIKSSQNFTYACLEFEDINVTSVKLIPLQAITIDGFAIGKNVDSVTFTPFKQNVTPNKVLTDNKMTLKYDGIDTVYTVTWDNSVELVRRILCDDIGPALEHRVHDHVFNFFDAGGKDVYEVLVGKPIYLLPNESKTVTFTVFCGDENVLRKEQLEFSLNCNNCGEKFAFSQNFIATNTLLNIVYPIYNRRSFIRHSTPGRFWDCLYQWDSGMIGIGLGVTDFNRAYECLNTYLTPVGDKHSPFIFAGSLVPTQIFLYKYLFDKYPENRDKLLKLYPMIKQYYDFYAKMDADVCQVNSGLIKTWHLFYNSGGWDDYPPQKHIRLRTIENEKTATYNDTTCVITTAETVLIAKILKNISLYFGFNDQSDYEVAIAKYSAVIEDNLFDDECGYYSYMIHDENGKPKNFLRYQDGTNYNQGLDGVYPYIAGISSKERSQKVLENIKNGLLTEYGVSAVDTRASYFSKKGYWNGSVWIPHQWILFISLLDRGEIDLACQIANVVLSVWQRECYDTYNSFEHFMIENGRGAGFPQFSGLSSPVLSFFESFYVKNSVTVGFETLITKKTVTKTGLEFKTITAIDTAYAIVCLDDSKKYSFAVNGKKVNAKLLVEGAYVIKLNKGESEVAIKLL